MLEDKKLLFMGAGNMAEAILKGLLQSGLVPARQVCMTELNADRRLWMIEKYGVRIEHQVSLLIEDADIIVLAVKPQQMEEALKSLSQGSLKNKLLITIAAGLSLSFYKKHVDADIIRVMPNLGALVLQSISALTTDESVKESDKEIAAALLGSVGKVVWVNEDQMDAVTALSGSGPAYFFYLMEVLIEVGIELGFDQSIAEELVKQTALGASQLVRDEGPLVLRKKVTSPGGTTEAAIKTWEKANFRDMILKGVKSALKRAQELNKES